jgi:hypothetical protein
MADIKDPEKNIRELTPTEKQQIEYLEKEYPHLSTEIFETILRLSNQQRDKICDEIKSGDLKHEESMEAEKYLLKTVKVE